MHQKKQSLPQIPTQPSRKSAMASRPGTSSRPGTAHMNTLRNQERPFTSAGRLLKLKYESSDSGLASLVQNRASLKSFTERHEKVMVVKQIEEKSKGFRWFEEYDLAVAYDMFITIEFCTNCQDHRESTRHNEEKYAMFANTLRRGIIKVYPAINVVLKPLIIDNNDESPEGMYLRTRLGKNF